MDRFINPVEILAEMLLGHKARNMLQHREVPLKVVYLLAACSRVLPEKLRVPQLVNKLPTFYGTRRFITAFTSAHHLYLSWTTSIQSMPSHPTSWRSILMLSSHLCLGLPMGLFPSGFPTKTMYATLLSSYVLHAPPTSLFSILSPKQYWVRSTDDWAPHCVAFSIPMLSCPS